MNNLFQIFINSFLHIHLVNVFVVRHGLMSLIHKNESMTDGEKHHRGFLKTLNIQMLNLD